MSILWCGGEDVDFITGNKSISTASSFRRGAFSRYSFEISSARFLASDPPLSTPQSSLWLHAIYGVDSAAPVGFFGLSKSGTYAALGITNDGNNHFAICTYDLSDYSYNILVSGTSPVPGLTYYQIDLQVIDYNDTVNGIVRLYVNGKLECQYTGDLTLYSQTTLDQVFGRNPSSTYRYFISEIIVADEDTRLMSLKTLVPNAAGDTNNWTGAYTDVDENDFNPDDVIYVNSAEQDFMCNLTGMPTGSFLCRAVKASALVGDGTGNYALQLGIKTNGSTDFSSNIPLNNAWERKENIWNQNPITVSPFTPAEIESLQLILRSKSV